jgi:DNA polymerase-3 subunit alpha
MANLALTDTCNLYGAVDFYKNCKDKGVHPVFGAELWVDPRGIGLREGGLDAAYQLVLLVEDQAGYENLCAIVTRAIFDGIYYRPRIDLEILASITPA